MTWLAHHISFWTEAHFTIIMLLSIEIWVCLSFLFFIWRCLINQRWQILFKGLQKSVLKEKKKKKKRQSKCHLVVLATVGINASAVERVDSNFCWVTEYGRCQWMYQGPGTYLHEVRKQIELSSAFELYPCIFCSSDPVSFCLEQGK